MAHTEQSLRQDLQRMGIDPGGTLMIHVSYKSIGAVEGGGDAVLDALSGYMAGGMLVLPSHTWGNVNAQNPVFDVLRTPVCVGYLPELFRARQGALRSWHPTHSLCALGAGAGAFIEGEQNAKSPCPKGFAYYKLYEADAQILLIGVDFTCNTYIHGVEEWLDVPNNLAETPEDLYVVAPDGTRYHAPQNRHCSAWGSSIFWKAEAPARAAGVLRDTRFGDAACMLVRARALYDLLAPIIRAEPGYFSHE